MRKMAKEKQFLTVIEAAKAMGVTRAAIYKKMKNGQIPFEKVYGHFLIPVEGVEGGVTRGLTEEGKAEIDQGVAKAMKEYGETLKLLGKE